MTIQWRPDSGGPAGLVIAVRPAGWLPAGTRVLLTGSAAPGTTGKPEPGQVRPAAVWQPAGPTAAAAAAAAHRFRRAANPDRQSAAHDPAAER